MTKRPVHGTASKRGRKPSRPYLVCKCGKWIYAERVAKSPHCECGAPWQTQGARGGERRGDRGGRGDRADRGVKIPPWKQVKAEPETQHEVKEDDTWGEWPKESNSRKKKDRSNTKKVKLTQNVKPPPVHGKATSPSASSDDLSDSAPRRAGQRSPSKSVSAGPSRVAKKATRRRSPTESVSAEPSRVAKKTTAGAAAASSSRAKEKGGEEPKKSSAAGSASPPPQRRSKSESRARSQSSGANERRKRRRSPSPPAVRAMSYSYSYSPGAAPRTSWQKVSGHLKRCRDLARLEVQRDWSEKWWAQPQLIEKAVTHLDVFESQYQ